MLPSLFLSNIPGSSRENVRHISIPGINRHILIIIFSVHLQRIESRIHEIRKVKVMPDFDPASLYEVETRVLNQGIYPRPG
jgi:hypothetical protein